MNAAAAVVEAHRQAGRFFSAAGVQSFVREEGSGAPVVLMHGVPASSFLYRKVLPELAARSLRGVAFDLPGLGLADRPEDFDYSWSGLGRFSVAAIEALGLDRFHLVVHDIGGPVGFEVAAEMPSRVLSLTLLNTVINVASFRRPWVMQPFATTTWGPLWLKTMLPPIFRELMFIQGVEDRAAMSTAEIDAWLVLLKRQDGGRAFLSIMRGFELTAAKQARYRATVRDVPYPVQIVWGAHDPALTMKRYAREAQEAAGLDILQTVPGKHFLQEDNAPAIANHIAELAERTAA